MILEYQTIVAQDVDVSSMQAVILIMENKLDEAESLLYVALEINPLNFDLLYNLGYLYELKNDLTQAVEYYKKAYNAASSEEQRAILEATITKSKLHKNDSTLMNENMINTVVKSATKQPIEQLDQEIIQLFASNELQKIFALIQDKIKSRKFQEVIKICDYWLQNIGQQAIINIFLGQAYNGLEQFEMAINQHKKAMEIDKALGDIAHKQDVYKGKYKERQVKCIGCGEKDFDIVWVGNQSVQETNKGLINPLRIWVKCKQCGLIYANPQPDESVMNKYYSIIAKEKFGGVYGDIENRFNFLTNMANNRLNIIESFTSNQQSLLDIGAGIGTFVGVALDKGWDAKGLELTPEDCEYARDHFGLKLLQKNFYDFTINEQYDVVTLFEVIEHLRKPLDDLMRINRLVRNNGLLVVATPISDSLYAQKTKENNVFWNVVSHLSYFSRPVLVDYLKKAGFEVLRINSSDEGMGRMEFYCRKISSIK